MADIDTLRRMRKAAVSREHAIVHEQKELDARHRSLRGELDKVRKEARALTKRIKDLAKDEDEL